MLEYRSTRFRLTAWAAFMLSATLAIMGVSGWFAMRASLYRAIDEDLENRLLDVEKFLQSQSDLSHEGVRKELGIRSSLGMGTSFYMVFDDLGNELYRSPQVGEYNLDVPPENPSDRIRFLKEGSYVANQNSLIHSLRTASKRINVRGTGIVIEVVEPLNGVDLALLYFERFLLIGVPILMGLGTLGAFWITRRALAPVDRITMDARSITAHNLSGRLAVPKAVDELRRLSETLNQMLDRIETSFKSIRQFTADASHELRAPMTLIHAAADFSLRRDRSKEELQDAMERILRESKRTTALVDDLLLIARSDSDPAAFERNTIDLSSMLNDVSAQARTLAQAKHLKIVPQIPEPGCCHCRRRTFSPTSVYGSGRQRREVHLRTWHGVDQSRYRRQTGGHPNSRHRNRNLERRSAARIRSLLESRQGAVTGRRWNRAWTGDRKGNHRETRRNTPRGKPARAWLDVLRSVAAILWT